MISCHDAEALIARRIDGEEMPQDARVLDQHLSGCPACARQLEAERALDAALVEKLGRIEAPAALAARVRRRLDAEPPVASRAAWVSDALNATGVLVSLGIAAPLGAAFGGGVVGATAGLAVVAVGLYTLLLGALGDAESEDPDPARSIGV